MEVKDFNLSDWDDFDFLNLFKFEDEQFRGYINPTPMGMKLRKLK